MLLQAVAEQDARITSFKNEVTKQQETAAASFTRDTERLQTNLDKVRSEIRRVLLPPLSSLNSFHSCCRPTWV